MDCSSTWKFDLNAKNNKGQTALYKTIANYTREFTKESRESNESKESNESEEPEESDPISEEAINACKREKQCKGFQENTASSFSEREI